MVNIKKLTDYAALALTSFIFVAICYTHITLGIVRLDYKSFSSLNSSAQCVSQCTMTTSEKAASPQKPKEEGNKYPYFGLILDSTILSMYLLIGVFLTPLFKRSSWKPPDLLVLYGRSLLHA